jgi:hypothetical protein
VIGQIFDFLSDKGNSSFFSEFPKARFQLYTTVHGRNAWSYLYWRTGVKITGVANLKFVKVGIFARRGGDRIGQKGDGDEDLNFFGQLNWRAGCKVRRL